VGVWGPKEVAAELKRKIKDLLDQIKLELSLEKTFITNA